MKRKRDDGIDRNDSADEPIVTELSGYVDLGLKREACRVAREILAQKRISATAFNGVITAIGVVSDPKKWRTEIESSWQRQSAAFRRETNSAMLAFYGSSNDWENAALHAKPDWLRSVSDFLFGVEALLEMGRMKEAKRAARQARQMLEAVDSEFEIACLVEALAVYHARIREWPEAFELWSVAPRTEPFARNAAIGRVQLSLVQALGLIREELKVLRDLPFTGEQEITLPGNADGIRRQTESELRKLQSTLEKLVPAARRKELGVREA